MSEKTIAEKLTDIANDIPIIRQKAYAEGYGVGSGNGKLVTIADITLEEAVNIIVIDESTFPDIAKVKDFYIAFDIGKAETLQSGKLLISGSKVGASPILGVIDPWNYTDYIAQGNFYSKWFDDNFRFNICTDKLGANGFSSMNLGTTIYKTTSPLEGITIKCQTATSQIPVGTKIKIRGYIGI